MPEVGFVFNDPRHILANFYDDDDGVDEEVEFVSDDPRDVLSNTYHYHAGIDFDIKLSKIARSDDRHMFVTLMDSYPFRRDKKVEKVTSDPEPGAEYCPIGIFDTVCETGAIGCGTGLLEGETRLRLDLNVDPEDGRCPLLVAADRMCYSMIEILLRQGARTNTKSKETDEVKGGLMPLNVALEKLSYHESLEDWTTKDPVLKSIILLSLPKMKIPLQVIELLAWNTKQLDDVFYYYAMEGKLIEMAALLMVAREKVLAAKMDIYQHIQEEILSITGDENELMKCNNGGRWASVIRDKRLGMMSALKLLEVFEKAGDRVEAYVQSVQSEMTEQEVVKGILSVLEENELILNFDLSNKDWESEKIKLEKLLYEQVKQEALLFGNKELVGRELEDRAMEKCSGHIYSPWANFCAQRFRGATVNDSPLRFFRPGSPLFPRFIYSSSELRSGYHVLPKKITTRKKSFPDLLSAKMYARFGLLMKKGLRHI